MFFIGMPIQNNVTFHVISFIKLFIKFWFLCAKIKFSCLDRNLYELNFCKMTRNFLLHISGLKFVPGCFY